MTEGRYADPAALRQAINARLRALAREDPQLQLTDLQRQFAYDRFLTRVFLAPDGERWVLKGAAALLARLHGRTRHTLDLDLYREKSGLDDAEAALRAAAALEVGDFFRFTLSPGRPITQTGAVRRVPVVAYLGATEFASFHVDLIVGIAMTGEPDDGPPLVAVGLLGLKSAHFASTHSPITWPTRSAPSWRCIRPPLAPAREALDTAISRTWRSSLIAR